MQGDKRLFDWSDYLVFAGMLAVSAAIGLYHGCRRRGQSSSEFLTGNGQLGTVPVALSMLASFLSSITLMGQPAEVYLFGPQLWLFGLASFLAIPFTGYVLIPMYHELRLTSAFEYIGRRFNCWLQLFTSTLFSLQMIVYLALVLYAPAMALHQVTGINTEIVVTAMYLVCILYTTVGGMKAVVWTDTFQVLVLYSSMVAILWKGTSDLGGVSVVWQRNAAANRTQFFNWDTDLTERYTLWGSFIGAACLHCAVYGVNQLQVQRYLTVPTVQAARKMLWINAFGWTFVVALTVYAGMLIFAQYFECDPLLTGDVSKPDQLFPLYVMDILGTVPGFPGLFVAGIFSAGLSTVSTGVNSLAAIWLAEINGVFLKEHMDEKRAAIAVKVLALVFGLASFFLVFLVPYMGGLVPVAVSLSSFFSGALLGVFLLGIYCPWANAFGVGAGLVAGVALVGGMTVGSQIAVESGQTLFTPLATSVEGCSNSTFDSTISLIMSSEPKDEAHFLLRISFLWYSLLATVATVLVGLLVSLVTRDRSPVLPSGSRLLNQAAVIYSNKEHHMTQSCKCGLDLRNGTNEKASAVSSPTDEIGVDNLSFDFVGSDLAIRMSTFLFYTSLVSGALCLPAWCLVPGARAVARAVILIGSSTFAPKILIPQLPLFFTFPSSISSPFILRIHKLNHNHIITAGRNRTRRALHLVDMDAVDLMSVQGIPMPTVDAVNSRQQQQSEVERLFKIQLESGAHKNLQNMMGNVESRPPQKIFQSPSKEELVLALKRIVQEKEMKLLNAKVQIASLSSKVANQERVVAVYEGLNKKDVELHKQYKEFHKRAVELHKVNASLLELKDQKIRDLENQLATPPSAHNQETKGSDSEKWMLRTLVTFAEKLKEHGLLTIQYQKKLTDWKAGMMSDEQNFANYEQAAVEEVTQDSTDYDTLVIDSNKDDAEDPIVPVKIPEIAPEKESDEESELQVALPSVPDVKGDVTASHELGASKEQGLVTSLPEEVARVLPESTENVDMQEVEAGAGANVEEKKDGEKIKEPTEKAKHCSTGQEGGLPNLYPENADSNDNDLDDRMEALFDDLEVLDDSRVGNDSLILHSRSGSDGSNESGMQVMDGLQPDGFEVGAGHDPDQQEPKLPVPAELMETAQVEQTANLAVEEAVGSVKALSPAADSEAVAINEEPVGEPEQSSTVKDHEAVSATGPVNGLAQKKRRKRKTSIFSRKRKSPASRKPRTQKESVPEEPIAEESQVQEAELSEPEAEVQEPEAYEEEKEASLPMKISRKRKGTPGPKETLPGVPGTLFGTWMYSPGKEDRPLTLIKANLPTKSCHLMIYGTPCDDEDSAGDDPQVQPKIIRWADKDAEPAPQDDLPDDIPEKMVVSSISKPAKGRKHAKISKMAKLKGQLSKTCPFLQSKLQ
ncbi:Hypothetical predicted protein [Cloeon dipterum]|uniref:Uncharacterized protein n=1 Tax=Cloeon dipterum TaxID=197152 RepID=A0A8S1CE39_9INSE|nr:Hypothetical predicted protein [Cloeon dipterum]